MIVKEGYFTQPGGNPGRTYDVSSDSKRFLMIKQSSDNQAGPPQIVIVENWHQELKRLVPTN